MLLVERSGVAASRAGERQLALKERQALLVDANALCQRITLKRVNVQSMGSGGYNIGPTSRPFNVAIAPGATEQVEFTLPSNADPSVAGVNGAVAMRVIAQFDTAQGAFENTTVHQVEGRIR